MEGSGEGDLYDRFAEVLPKDHESQFHHITTPPTRCDPLFAPPPGRKPERTYCETNFLTVSYRDEGTTAGSVLVFAVEVLVYTTRRLTTIFVSKADSTGCLASLGSKRDLKGSPIRDIFSTYIQWLVENRQRPNARLVVSLFARAQDQYLFPGSVDNKGKHVLDDRQLVKWWCKTLDPVLRMSRKTDTKISPNEETKAEGFVIVPGFDKHETKAFFPPTWRVDPPEKRRWQFGHPLKDLTPHPSAPPRCLVPRFPDDPKARYVDELDEELPDQSASQSLASPSKKGSGNWKSIKTLEQFWEMMSFRQECSSGRMVGFVWVVFTPPGADQISTEDRTESQDTLQSGASTPLGDYGGVSSVSEVLHGAKNTKNIKQKPRKGPLTGPITPRAPKVKSAASGQNSGASLPEESRFWRWPESSRGQVILDKQVYDRVHDLLLKLDFSDLNAASQSTTKWLDEVLIVAGPSPQWGKNVTGTKRVSDQTSNNALKISGTTGQPNDLSTSIVRKKRKADAAHDPPPQAASISIPAVNVLSSSMVRKKPKVK